MGWTAELFTGEDGYELYIPSEMAMAAHEALVAAGANATQGYTPVQPAYRAASAPLAMN